MVAGGRKETLLLLLSCFSHVAQTMCDPTDGSPPGSPIPGILQARTLEWVAISSPTHERKSESEVAQSCPTLSDPVDCSLPGSSVHGIFQARVLDWVAIAFSRRRGGEGKNEHHREAGHWTTLPTILDHSWKEEAALGLQP